MFIVVSDLLCVTQDFENFYYILLSSLSYLHDVTSQLWDFILKNLRMKRPLVNLLRLLNVATKVVTGCLRTSKVSIFVVLSFRDLFIWPYGKYWICLHIFINKFYDFSNNNN